MTIEVLLIIIAVAIIACYLVFRWQDSVINTAIPPYQEPVKPDMAEQWVAAAAATSVKLEPTAINPQATWPFPHGDKP
jgi:hypothetical protein